jgi:hypothetical protein
MEVAYTQYGPLSTFRQIRMTKDRIPEKIFNIKLIRKHSRGRPRSRWEQQIRKDVL